MGIRSGVISGYLLSLSEPVSLGSLRHQGGLYYLSNLILVDISGENIRITLYLAHNKFCKWWQLIKCFWTLVTQFLELVSGGN